MMHSAKTLVIFYFLTRINGLVEGSVCGVTICTRYNKGNDQIACDKGRILIGNVTESDLVTENKWAQKSLQRICNGRTVKCDAYQICQNRNNQNLRVTYTCNYLPDSEPDKLCTNDIKVLNKEHGFIFSPRYPDIIAMSCSWVIHVPEGHFAVLILHDLAKAKTDRESGLQIRTTRPCPSVQSPNSLIYALKEEVSMQACGNVDIDLITNGVSGLRFWITYRVLPLTRAFQPEYPVIYSCPAGAKTEHEMLHSIVEPPGVPPRVITKINLMNITSRSDNESFIDQIENKNEENINTAERMIFYVAIGLAFLSIQALIIVIVVCIRRQRHLKANGPIIDHSTIPTTYPSLSSRPLPPVQSSHAQLTISPSLMEGYGVVADEIEQGCYEQNVDTCAYAEVDDTYPYRTPVQQYGIEKAKPHEAIENVYSELKDCDKGGYCEIADTTWHSPITHHDQAKLIKGENKARRSQFSNYSGRSRKSSLEGPFSIEHRRSQNTEQSDSEDSLFGNEQYDYIDTAHV